MKAYDIIVLTDQRYLEDNVEPYKHNVFYEDALVVNALKDMGLRVARKAWDDAHFDWSNTKTILFRTTWDYFDRFEEFSKWLSLVAQQTQLINSERLIRWNLDKHYLLDLAKQKVNIPETVFIERDNPTTLKAWHDSLGWSKTILKPCVSGAGRHTYRLNPQNLKAHEALFQELIANESMMLQPFQYRIVHDGEISMMLFNGQFTHAVLKQAKAGDFRVQDDFGGTVKAYDPSDAEINFAENALKACPELPIYARVDIFTDNKGELALSELELIEPELWFRKHPEAASVLAKAVSEYLIILK